MPNKAEASKLGPGHVTIYSRAERSILYTAFKSFVFCTVHFGYNVESRWVGSRERKTRKAGSWAAAATGVKGTKSLSLVGVLVFQSCYKRHHRLVS